MPDIMKFIVNENTSQMDPRWNLASLEEWSEEIARKRAAEQNIALTPKHWEVIHFLRDYYREHGLAPSARPIRQELEKKFANEGGRKFLYLLFPKGAVNQGSQIAGLPIPAYSSDPSFGTTE